MDALQVPIILLIFVQTVQIIAKVALILLFAYLAQLDATYQIINALRLVQVVFMQIPNTINA